MLKKDNTMYAPTLNVTITNILDNFANKIASNKKPNATTLSNIIFNVLLPVKTGI